MSPPFQLALIISPPGRWREGLGVLIQAGGWTARVVYADEAQAGLARLPAFQPALVLLDAGLPGGEAWRALDRILQSCPQARCIVLARNHDQELQARHGGAEAVLQVGFSGAHLSSAIRSFIETDEIRPGFQSEAGNTALHDRMNTDESSISF